VGLKFDLLELNYGKFLEMGFFPLPIPFRELQNYKFWKKKIEVLLEML